MELRGQRPPHIVTNRVAAARLSTTAQAVHVRLVLGPRPRSRGKTRPSDPNRPSGPRSPLWLRYATNGVRVVGDLPKPLLVARHEHPQPPDRPIVVSFCVGYEQGRWRLKELSRHLIRWLPDFVLDRREQAALGTHNMVEKFAQAARTVYATDDYARRGEFGELILHALMRQHFGAEAVIAKLHYKTGRNDTVKGFDGVHMTVDDDGISLWLGEAKFYSDINSALRDALKSIDEHLEAEYLRDEFMLISGKVDPEWEYAEAFEALVSSERRLEDILTNLVIPIMLTYDSTAVASHADLTDAYSADLAAEADNALQRLMEADLSQDVEVVLLLVPLRAKSELAKALHEHLTAAQSL